MPLKYTGIKTKDIRILISMLTIFLHYNKLK